MGSVKYARLPAAAVMVLSAAASVWYGLALRDATARTVTSDDVYSSARKVASGQADVRTWFAYAEKLRADREFGLAAEAYQRIIEKEPYHREARYWTAICLAGAGDAAGLEEYMERLTASEAKLAVEIMQRAELSAFTSSPRMSTLRDQAVDQARD